MNNRKRSPKRDELLGRWYYCGLTKSLQEIFAECEWVQVCSECFDATCFQCGFMHDGVIPDGVKVPKPSPEADLFTFLLDLGL